MDIQSFNQRKPSNLIPFNKNRKRAGSRQRSHEHNNAKQMSTPLNKLLSTAIQLLSIPATLLFFVTSSLFQMLLRLAYGGILVIGLLLISFAGILALFAGGKTPAHFWQSVWHGESVLLLLVMGGLLLDAILIAIQLYIGATRTRRPQKATGL